MIASLPMYQRPQLVGAHDRYWRLIRRELGLTGIDSPEHLSQHTDEFATWADPSLVLSQTCGMPFRNELHDRVTLVGTPDFGLEGCPPGYGRSAFVVRRDDPRSSVTDFADATFAWNQHHSQSGFCSPYHHVASLGFWFERRHHAGQHLASARAVADDVADIASIDAVTLRLIDEHESFAAKLRVIDWTEPVPWLPYIAAPTADATSTFDAVANAISDLGDDDRDALGIQALVAIPADAYLAVVNPPDHITDSL